MPDPFNPSSGVFGLEWFATQVEQPGLSTTQLVGVRVPSTASESISGISVFVDALVAGTNGDGTARVSVDVYDDASALTAQDGHGVLANPVVANASTSTPTTVFTRCTGTSVVPATSAAFDANAWQDVGTIYGDNDALPAPSATVTYIRYLPALATDVVWLTEHMNTSVVLSSDGTTATTHAGKRVTRLSVVAVLANPWATAATFRGVIRQGGVNYLSAPITVPAFTSWSRYRVDFDYSPVTGKQWTHGDLVDVMNGGTGSVGVSLSAAGPVFVHSIMLRAWLMTETRLATGAQGAPLGATSGWTTILLADPADNSLANWAKASGHNYVIVFSLGGFGGQAKLSAPYSVQTGGGAGLASNGWKGVTVAAKSGGEPLDVEPTLFPWVPAVFMQGGVDAQPYVRPTALPAGPAGTDVAQVITGVSGSVGVVAFLAQMDSDGRGGALQDGPLTVCLCDSAGTELATVDVVSLSATGLVDGTWHRVIARVANTSPGTPARVKFRSTSTVPWKIGALLTYGTGETVTNATANSLTYGGTTARALISGAAHGEIDLPAYISPPPAAPTALGSAEAFTANRIATAGRTHVPTISVAHLTWTKTAQGANFDHYDIQRWDTDRLLGAGTWATVIRITDENKQAWDDQEPRRTVDKGLASQYRIRVVRTDGIPSDWAVFPNVNIGAVDCAVYLTSNQATTLPIAFYDTTPYQRTWPEMDDEKLVKMQGRDLPVRFRPTERMGDAFTRRVLVAGNDSKIADSASAAYRPGGPIFDPVLSLLEATDPPYLAWGDSHGNRWFAAVRLTGGTQTEPGGFYAVEAQVQQISLVGIAFDDPTPWTAP